MVSQRQLEANRRNARKSAGPKTAAGRRTASQNARTHGLNAIAMRDASIQDAIAKLAAMICGGDSTPIEAELATIIAESEITLRRVRAARVSAIERRRVKQSPSMLPVDLQEQESKDFVNTHPVIGSDIEC